MADLFWWVATSDLALWIDAAVLVAALLVGFAPLISWVPVLGAYVPLARVIAVVLPFVMGAAIGHRIADESATVRELRNDLAFADDQLTWQKQAADDAEKLRADAESKADAANQKVADYAAELAKLPADRNCTLTDDDLRRLRDIAH